MIRLAVEVSLRQIIIAPFLPIAVRDRICIGALVESVWVAPAVLVGGIAAENTLYWLLLATLQTSSTPPPGKPAVGPVIGPGTETPPGSSTTPVVVTRATETALLNPQVTRQ